MTNLSRTTVSFMGLEALATLPELLALEYGTCRWHQLDFLSRYGKNTRIQKFGWVFERYWTHSQVTESFLHQSTATG